MGANWKQRHTPALTLAFMVLTGMVIGNQSHPDPWAADLIMAVGSLALLGIVVWCGFTEVMRCFRSRPAQAFYR